MKKAFLKIFALTLIVSLQAQGPESFFLGQKFVPPWLEYRDLARAIEWELKNLRNVKVLGLDYSPAQRRLDASLRGHSLNNIDLQFEAHAYGKTKPQFFYCTMGVHVWRSEGSVDIWISWCQNFEGVNISNFTIRELVGWSG